MAGPLITTPINRGVSKRDAQKYYKRINKLADFLQTLPKLGYSHSSWIEFIDKDNASPEYFDKIPNDGTCGTVCCALGWAAESGMFKRQGLVTEVAPNGETYPILQSDLDKGASANDWVADGPVGITTTLKHASDTIFGPQIYNAIFTSFGSWSATNKKVANRLRRFADQAYSWAVD